MTNDELARRLQASSAALARKVQQRRDQDGDRKSEPPISIDQRQLQSALRTLGEASKQLSRQPRYISSKPKPLTAAQRRFLQSHTVSDLANAFNIETHGDSISGEDFARELFVAVTQTMFVSAFRAHAFAKESPQASKQDGAPPPEPKQNGRAPSGMPRVSGRDKVASDQSSVLAKEKLQVLWKQCVLRDPIIQDSIPPSHLPLKLVGSKAVGILVEATCKAAGTALLSSAGPMTTLIGSSAIDHVCGELGDYTFDVIKARVSEPSIQITVIPLPRECSEFMRENFPNTPKLNSGDPTQPTIGRPNSGGH